MLNVYWIWRRQMGLFNFIAALVLAGTTVSGASLLWPKLTSRQRPPLLTQVRQILVGTPFGSQAAQVLGVSDETRVAPLNVASLAATFVDTVTSAVEHKARQAVTERVVQQVVEQFDQLSTEQKRQIKQTICKP